MSGDVEPVVQRCFVKTETRRVRESVSNTDIESIFSMTDLSIVSNPSDGDYSELHT